MAKQQTDLKDHLVGDKVRVRKEANTGLKGKIQEIEEDGVVIKVGDILLKVDVENITNYSLAARRAWQVMPKRAGRPPEKAAPKKMISIRIESELWDKLGQAADDGLIVSREHAINEWIRKNLQALAML